MHRRAEAATPGRGGTGTKGPHFEDQDDALHRSMRREGVALHGNGNAGVGGAKKGNGYETKGDVRKSNGIAWK